MLLQDHYLIEQMANWTGSGFPSGSPRQGKRRVRPFRGQQGRQPVDQGRCVSAGRKGTTCWRGLQPSPASAAAPTRGATAGFRDEVLHQSGQLRHRREQHAGILHPRSDEVPRLHPFPERRADSNLRDHDMQWDFWTLSPESAHMVIWLMGDRGMPKSWRQMDGFSSHTYMWVNAKGQEVLGQIPFQVRAGCPELHRHRGEATGGRRRRRLPPARPLGGDRAQGLSELGSQNADHAVRRAAKTYRFNPFDMTKVWPHKDYPLIRSRPDGARSVIRPTTSPKSIRRLRCQ